eukprot:TRINITY_DN98040_c0_g1_i1.p1 TRINITY_DN98040_c0_g1~~TRINITY_DN98040_c0_g1_i1.p1  ORF type:complete len:398 (+),score=64.89 TRINITY_DN98040_c0_g1_i1:26-1195(+)
MASAAAVEAMTEDCSFLERIGVNWSDSVQEANEKRIREYDRQQEQSIAYSCSGYTCDWSKRLNDRQQQGATEEWILENRQKYLKSFDMEKGKTQLAVSISVEEPLKGLLEEARDEISTALFSLNGSPEPHDDIDSSPVFLPSIAHIPKKDFHVTVCIPSLWREPDPNEQAHRAYNESVADALNEAARDHEAFTLEVDRLMLSWDGSLVCLFRTVGPTGDEDDSLCDRSSEMQDPMSCLRADVLHSFFAKKLAHVQRQKEHDHHFEGPTPPKLLREATIVKTVGGSAHGYIHCSLSRLAVLPSLTYRVVDLEELQQLCRKWTHRLTGRRMLVKSFTLSEMTGLGAGGNKNPFDKALWRRDITLQKARDSKRESPKVKNSLTRCGGCFAWL